MLFFLLFFCISVSITVGLGPGFDPQDVFLCGVCMFLLCMHEFPSGLLRSTGYFKLPIGVNGCPAIALDICNSYIKGLTGHIHCYTSFFVFPHGNSRQGDFACVQPNIYTPWKRTTTKFPGHPTAEMSFSRRNYSFAFI